MSAIGTSQPWQLPRRTAGHGSKADAGAQPLAGCQSAGRRIAELEQEIDQSADRRHRCATRARMPAMGRPGLQGHRGAPTSDLPPQVVLGVKVREHALSEPKRPEQREHAA